MDLDVDHYSREELIELLGLEVVTKDTIVEAIRQKIDLLRFFATPTVVPAMQWGPEVL